MSSVESVSHVLESTEHLRSLELARTARVARFVDAEALDDSVEVPEAVEEARNVFLVSLEAFRGLAVPREPYPDCSR